MKHHVMRNHVMGNHISRGTAVLHFIYRYIFCLLLFRVMHTCVVICSEKWEYFLHSTKKQDRPLARSQFLFIMQKSLLPFFKSRSFTFSFFCKSSPSFLVMDHILIWSKRNASKILLGIRLFPWKYFKFVVTWKILFKAGSSKYLGTTLLWKEYP